MAYTFDGNGDYVTYGTTPAGFTDFTISFWLKTNESTYIPGLWDSANTNSDYVRLFLNMDSSAVFARDDVFVNVLNAPDANRVRGAFTCTNLTDDNWHHVAISLDNSAKVITGYYDGSSQSVTHSLQETSGTITYTI